MFFIIKSRMTSSVWFIVAFAAAAAGDGVRDQFNAVCALCVYNYSICKRVAF